MTAGSALVATVGQSPEAGTSTGSAFAHENQPKLVQNLGELPSLFGRLLGKKVTKFVIAYN